MSKRIDAPVELTDAEIALVAGGDAGIGSVSTIANSQLVGGHFDSNYTARNPSNGFFQSGFRGALFSPSL